MGSAKLGLALTIDEVVGRYLRHVAWGQRCADHLRTIGFEAWRDRFRASHQRNRNEGGSNEWDSWDYSDAELRQTYDEIIAHAEAGTVPDEEPDIVFDIPTFEHPLGDVLCQQMLDESSEVHDG